MIYRLDLGRLQIDANRDTFAGTQLVWAILGLATFAGVLLVVRDHRRLQSVTYTFGFAALAFLVLPLLPIIGSAHYGARIWINVGPFSFQPGEAAKICLAIFFAGYLVVKRDALALAGRRVLGIDLPRGRDLGPILVGWGISVGILVLQRDLGSSLLFFGLFVVMLYVATERSGWLVVGGVLFACGAYFGYVAFGHVRTRFDAWLDPFGNPDQNGQIISGLFGLGHGGILGAGWGMLDPNATVTLTVSLGKEKISIPRLSGYTYDDAKDLLESDQYGLQVEKSEQDSSAPEDEVINSNPPEGTEVDKGSTVTLLVSKGEQSVPDVVGQSVSSATSELEDAGFDVKVNGPDDGIVTDQDPSDGDTAKKGSKVKITSKKKPDDNPSPDDSESPEDNSNP